MNCSSTAIQLPMAGIECISQLMTEFPGHLVAFAERAEYREKNLSHRARAEIENLLAQRCEQIESNCDIIVDRRTFPWDWTHHEIALRSLCFEITCAADIRWNEEHDSQWLKDRQAEGEDPILLLCEGWLLVENRCIVGAASFNSMRSGIDHSQVWKWDWVFIDPEHRRKGYVLKRLSVWEGTYGDFIIDQPNFPAQAMLKKAHFKHRIRNLIPGRGLVVKEIP